MTTANRNTVVFAGSSIYNASGASQGTTSPPECGDGIQVIGADTVYDHFTNAIYSVSTGSVICTSHNAISLLNADAVAGSHVVFASGQQVRAEPC